MCEEVFMLSNLFLDMVLLTETGAHRLASPAGRQVKDSSCLHPIPSFEITEVRH